MSIVWCDDWGIMDVLVLSIHFASLCQLQSFSGCLYKNVLLFLFHVPRPQKCFLPLASRETRSDMRGTFVVLQSLAKRTEMWFYI